MYSSKLSYSSPEPTSKSMAGCTGRPSPVDKCKRNAPSYFSQVLSDVDAGKIRSPLSNEKAKINHHRCWLLLDRKDCFDGPPQVQVHNEEPDNEFASILVSENQAEEHALESARCHGPSQGGAVKASTTCPVKAIARLIQSTLKVHGKLSKRASLFLKEDCSVYSRGDISEIYKLAAEAAGIPGAKVASHSARRGGSSAYIAAGASEEALQRFGRWTSDAYHAYVYPHAQILHKALTKAVEMVPRFELR